MQHPDEGTIHAWLDGALSPDEARQAEAHVSGCAACSAAVAEARGLIAASSMILSKLDVLEAGGDAADRRPPIAVQAPAAAGVSTLPVRGSVRHWLAGPRLRAAAAILVLAGGIAAVGTVIDRSDLPDVTTEPAVLRQAEGGASATADVAVAGDATAAVTEQAAPVAPPPTVTAAPAISRPPARAPGRIATRGAPQPGRPGSRTEVNPSSERAAANMVGDVSGVLAGAATEVVRTAAEPQQASIAQAAKAAAPASAPPARAASDLRTESASSAIAIQPDTSVAPIVATSGAFQGPPPPRPASIGAGTALGSADTSRTRRDLDRLREIREEASARRMSLADAPAPVGRQTSGARCYLLSMTPWTPASTSDLASIPDRIVLSADTGTVGASRGQRLIRAMPDDTEGGYQNAWWTEVSPSTLVLTWATGGNGVVMRLVNSGEGAAGTARTFGNSDGVERTSRVTARLADCGQAR